MSNVDWDAGHCYCQCDLCSIDEETGECDSFDCQQTLYCAPDLINQLVGKQCIVACDCAENTLKHDGLEAYVEYIEGFIGLADEAGHSDWYHTHLLKDWVKSQRLILTAEKLINNRRS